MIFTPCFAPRDLMEYVAESEPAESMQERAETAYNTD